MLHTDSMPRLQHLIPHLSALLRLLNGEGATFEACRKNYATVVRDLAAEGVGRVTVSRVGDADAYWSPTTEALNEAMRLDWVVRAPTPSARKYVPEHRTRLYTLTGAGASAAATVGDQGAFVTLVTEAVLDAHATMRSMLRLLEQAPLILPEVSESQLEKARSTPQPTQWLAAWAAETANQGPLGAVLSPALVAEEVSVWRRKRFGPGSGEPPDRKAMVDMLDDALASAALKARGLPIGAIGFRVAAGWASSLRLIEQSRYVPGHEGANVVWLACDLTEEVLDKGGGSSRLRVARRGRSSHGARTAQSLVAAYMRQAAHSEQLAPYVPIHLLRAEAAFSVGVTKGLVDMVIESLSSGAWPELGVTVYLHTGAGQVIPSEPAYRRGGGRRTALSMQPANRPSTELSDTESPKGAH